MKNWIWPLVVVLIVAGVAGFAYYVNLQHPAAPPPPPAATAVSAPPAAEPQTHYPIEPAAPAPRPLPALDQSDSEVSESLAGLFGQQTLIEVFQLKGLIRRVVATVDNLPRDRVAGRLMAVNRVPGQFAIAGGPGNLSISAGNYSRYTAYARVAQSLDAQKLVAVYVHLYPLFQQAYVELGYPKGYFNDRLVQVIDNLLAAPSPRAPVGLEQPNVLYTYADPDLESLSAGQKMMIRMGPENAAVVKEKLRAIRAAVTSSGLKH